MLLDKSIEAVFPAEVILPEVNVMPENLEPLPAGTGFVMALDVLEETPVDEFPVSTITFKPVIEPLVAIALVESVLISPPTPTVIV